MKRPFSILIILFSCLLIFVSSIQAADNPQSSGDITVSATIVGTGTAVSIPNLHSPVDGYVTNNPDQQFSWQRSTGDLMHYTFYLDDIAIISGITHEPAQDKTEWLATVDSSYVYFSLKAPLSEGSHRWSVRAQGSINHAYSQTWHFTIDTTPPLIVLQAVDKNIMYWSTAIVNSIPFETKRHLIVTNDSPLLSGQIETYTNLKISMVCPVVSLNCQSKSTITTHLTNHWESRLDNLVPDLEYIIYLTATDLAGNVTSFPVFYIVFPSGTGQIITATPPPSIDISPPPIPSIYPPTEDIKLGSYFRQPPPVPTLPPSSLAAPTFSKVNLGEALPYLYFLILFGLIIHLAMTLYGAKIKLVKIPSFLLDLMIPIIGKKPYSISPYFTTVEIFDPGRLNQAYSIAVTNVVEKTGLKIPPLKQVFIRLTRPGYEDLKAIVKESQIDPDTSIKMKPKDHPSTLERLQLLCLRTRVVPLMIANITSGLVLAISPNYYVLTYFLISLNLSYNKYIFPRITNK